MGQYYRPCFLKQNWENVKNPIEATLCSFDFDNGQKLMEHSWIGNNFVKSVEYLFATRFNGLPFAWVGDYADPKITKAYPDMIVRCYNSKKYLETCSVEEQDYIKGVLGELYNNFLTSSDGVTIPYNKEIEDKISTINYVRCEASLDLYEKAQKYCEKKAYKDLLTTIPKYEDLPYYKYVVNLTKKEYVILPEYNSEKWVIHPLPILCSDGNGRGGGDYYVPDDKEDEYDEKNVGRWAYDRIMVTNDKTAIKGMTRLKTSFKEDW